MRHDIRTGRLCEQPFSLRLQTEPGSLSEANRSKDPCRIIDRASVMKNARGFVLQGAASAIRIAYFSPAGQVQLNRHRVDREIAAAKVLVECGTQDVGK